MIIAVYCACLAILPPLLWYERRVLRSLRDPARLARIREQLDAVRKGFA